MGELFGRLVAGALWGAAAGTALVFGKEGSAGLRTAAKTVMKGYVAAEEKIGEARDSLDDLYAEAKGPAKPAPAASKRVPIEPATERPRAARSPNGPSHAATKTPRAQARS